MNLVHGNLNKLVRTGDLHKDASPADLQKDVRYRAGLALEALSTAVVDATPADSAGLREMLSSFVRALATYDDILDKDPAEAERRFSEEVNRIVRERALAQSLRSSLSKGMSPAEFFRR